MWKFSEADINSCWPYATAYLVEILNGTYSLDEARADLQSLIGTKYDSRIKK